MTITADPALEAPIPDAMLGKPFSVLLCVEGFESAEPEVVRMFELGSTDWRPLPIPFMVQDTTAHGPGQIPQPAWAAGQIESIERDPLDPTRIMGRGRLLSGPIGDKAEAYARGSFRSVSLDGYPRPPKQDTMQPTHVDQDGDPVAVLLRYAGTTIARVTMVPTPALVPCCIWFDDEEQPEVARLAHGGVIPEDTPPEVVHTAPTNLFEALVAAANSPTLLNPPRGWFFTPEPGHYQPIEVTPEGHWSGHIAPAGQCYLGTGENGVRCETAPPSKTMPPYKSFHRTAAKCDDGTEVACGFVTMGTNHADRNANLDIGLVQDQYDHTGTIGARVRCSNGRYGIWSSGALMPGLSDRELAILQGPTVSGDWRTWHDPDDSRRYALELMGVLGVPIPAFPGSRMRPELLVASGGEIIAQVGQITPCDEGEPMNESERAAMTALETKVDEQQRTIDVLVAAAPPEVAAALAAPAETVAAEAATEVAAAAGEGPAVEAVAGSGDGAAIAAATETEVAFDASSPLSPQEQAAWFAKYDPKARRKMAGQGKALHDGSMAIGDADDLRMAIRAGAPHAHLARNADALGLPELVPAPAEA